MSGYLVTGATGFVGGALVLELLAQTDEDIFVLVRNKGGEGVSPQSRIEAALHKAAECYGFESEFLASRSGRIHAVGGDLGTDLQCHDLEGFDISRVWHCAASLQFEDKDRAEIYRTNVDGTKRALDLAKRLGVESFNHVSTAYVAGCRTGIIEERPVTGEVAANNHYERSKIEAEGLVLGAQDSFDARIWRPSVVVGHSSTFAATSFTGMYGFIKQLVLFKKWAQDNVGTMLESQPMQILADPSLRVNLVPVDLVVKHAVSLSLLGTNSDVVHLTNLSPPTIGRAMGLIFEELGLCEPTFVDSPASFTPLDEEFDKGMKFHGAYMWGDKTFDQNVASSCGRPIDFVFDDEVLLGYYRWYLAKLRSSLEGRGMSLSGVLREPDRVSP